MKEMMSLKEAEKLWGISTRRISTLCSQGKIQGAIKQGKSWLMPEGTQKPTDGRVKSGLYTSSNHNKSHLPLPIGISDYRLATTEYYYVDKTLLIKDFIDEKPMVSLFTRPRRFGKTLNMDMLRTFFEKTDEDTSAYFNDKKIWSCGQKYRDYQGKYPVIFLSFKDIKKDTWEETLNSITQVIIAEFKRHPELNDSNAIQDGEFYNKVVTGNLQNDLMDSTLYMLSKMLHEHYGTAPIIIIDEYDTPIQQGYVKGFYDQVILFMRNLFSGAFKDNKHLSYGFLTGILRVSKESIFSGLNNLAINSILDERYSKYFGFTSGEVKEMCKYYGVPNKFKEICEWYDGYKFGDSDIFNPWSVINYFRNNCKVGAYWQSTGSNDIIGEILSDADENVYENLNALLQGKLINAMIDVGVVYPQIKNNPSSIYSFLLVAGYLKALKNQVAFNADMVCEVSIPNKEISLVYNKEILQKLNVLIPQTSAFSLQQAIVKNDPEELQKHLEKILLQSVSCFDAVGENFYHGLVLGLCVIMENSYYIKSNRESGLGRYDIGLMPKKDNYLAIIIELKEEKNCNEEQLEKLAQTALDQIDEKKYETEFNTHQFKSILKYGVAFSGKKVKIISKKQ